MNLTRNEVAAYRVVRDYRRRVDLEEKAVILQTALRFRYLEERIAAGVRSLQKPDPLNRAPMTRFFVDVRPEIYRLADIYARNTEKSMTDLAVTTARLGAETADKSARKVVSNDQRWEKVRTAGLLSGPLFNASKEAMRKIPHAITDRITDLVTQALGMAENGLDWLMSQIGDVMGNIWSGIQRTIRTLAEQMFRRGQQEQAKKTPVRKWRRIANHETACLACLMLEGTIYDKEEDFADHPNGRCTIVPVEDPNATDEHPGRDWFLEQDEETQRKIMGKGRFEAWQNGDIDLDDMVDVVNDPIYGPQPHIKPLKSFGLTP